MSESKAPHTPTPWYCGADGLRPIFIFAKGSCIAQSKKEVDSEFIVRAVNSHDALLEAAKLVQSSLIIKSQGDSWSAGWGKVLDTLSDAIALAEGGK